MVHRTSFLSRHRDGIASVFAAWSVQTCFLQRNVFKVLQRIQPFYNFLLYLHIFTEVLIIMSSGQKKGTCGHVMALFNGHLKCTRCRDKGVGDYPCVLKRDCPICKAFTPEQIHQLATPTYRERKNKEKKVSASPTPTLVAPSQVSVLGWVDGENTVKKSETPAGKKKRADESPKPSSRKNPIANPGLVN